MSADDWNAVLNYWFGGGNPEKRPQWFGGGEKAAEEIRQKFGPLVSYMMHSVDISSQLVTQTTTKTGRV
jgi:uncharacterized protein (DUF924 family)